MSIRSLPSSVVKDSGPLNSQAEGGGDQLGIVGQLLLEVALLGVILDCAAVFHTTLIEQLAAGLGIAIGLELRFFQIARHRKLPS